MSEGYRRRKRSIKGWLILPVIGLVISPIQGTIGLIVGFLPLFQTGTISAMLTPSSTHYNPGVVALIMVEIVGNVFFIFTALFLFYPLIQRSRWFPWAMISYYVLSLLFILSDLVISKLILNSPEGDSAAAGPLVRAILTVGIWVPYFVVSTRVKETFVR